MSRNSREYASSCRSVTGSAHASCNQGWDESKESREQRRVSYERHLDQLVDAVGGEGGPGELQELERGLEPVASHDAVLQAHDHRKCHAEHG